MSSRGRGRGGGGRNNREPPSRSVQISKKLSWLLRHGAESENLPLGPGGFANLADVLNNRKLKALQITFDEVRQVVDENEKQRFTMVPVSNSADEVDGQAPEKAQTSDGPDGVKQTPLASTDPKDYKIRANQGHSLKVEAEGLLTSISLDSIPETAVHGTTHAAWPQILASGGLKPMGRTHVHFATGLPARFTTLPASDAVDGVEADTQAPVISGMRNSSTILVFVDVKKAMDAGLKFWTSENGVVLSEGDEEGMVGVQFFKRVEDRTGEGVLIEEGKVVKEAPSHWGQKGGGGGRGRGRGRGKA
ncbi:tRNA 2'-phosphotransferase [Saxophila tyrrhenica]|uniref:2'-phosphotransferase n=1 Tax=Saxophila tyrrhenica TaxID=1690608 RepID=A0AAV9PKP4_9PEZI|nr:tRNA 2'-phosphotransferase [Saxophila tyrrhenica]